MYPNTNLNYWPQMQGTCTSYIAPRPICIGSSLWYSTDCDMGSGGMVEMDLANNCIKSVVPYRNGCQPRQHCVAKLGASIFIVDGINGVIFAFSPQKKVFLRKCGMPPIGNRGSCCALNGDIHIFNGYLNETGCHLVYCGATNKVRVLRDHRKGKGHIFEAVAAWNGHIVRFGGCNGKTKAAFCDFWMSSKVTGTPSVSLKWTRHKQCALPMGYVSAGYVVWRQWLLLFGGKYAPSKNSNEVLLLNLAQVEQGEARWAKLQHIECPVRSRFHAVLHRQKLHLIQFMTSHDEWHSHFMLSMAEIMGGLYDADSDYVPVPRNKAKPEGMDSAAAATATATTTASNAVVVHQHEGQHGAFSEFAQNTTPWQRQQKWQPVQRRKDELETDGGHCEQPQKPPHKEAAFEAEAECTECSAMREKAERAESMRQIIQQMLADKEQEIKDLKGKYQVLMAALNQKSTECERFKIANATLCDEFKEMTVELESTKLELDRMSKVLDTTKYRQWTPSEVVQWIVSLQPQKMRRYETTLREQFEKQGVNGLALEFVDKSSLFGWGVEDFMDRVQIEKAIQRLVAQHSIAYDEGQGTRTADKPGYL